MKEVLLPEDCLQHAHLREYLNYPSLILREVKSCKTLSDGAKHCWELLYDLSKFDAKRFIDISIKKIRAILSDSKSYRTIQRYLSQLAEYGFITIKKNYDSYGRIENTYSVKVPDFIVAKLEESPTKVFIKASNPLAKPVNTRYDKFVQGIEELTIKDINNCCPSDLDEKEEVRFEKEEVSLTDLPVEVQPETEVLEYYPAKEQPTTPAKAVLRHALKQVIKFEAKVTEKLTKAQEKVVKDVIGFWTTFRYVSAPKECFEWVQSVLLNPHALSRCGNSFLKKMNVIFKMIREKRFSKPFVQRYQEKAAYTAKQQEPVKKNRNAQAEGQSGISQLIGADFSTDRDARKNYHEQEKDRRIEALSAQVVSAKARLNSPEVQKDHSMKQSFMDLIQVLNVRIQEVQFA